MQVFHHTFRAMGTRLDLVLPGIDAGTGDEVGAAVASVVGHIERRLSRYDPDSIVSHLNAHAGEEPVALDDDVWEVLTACAAYHRRTGGAFDVTCFPLFTLWRERDAAACTPPTDEEIADALARCGMHRVELDPEARTVRFLHPELQLDLGAFGKGYALERVDGVFERYGIPSAFVSFGESSILARGMHPSGRTWPVGIEHLFDRGRSVFTVRLPTTAPSVRRATAISSIPARDFRSRGCARCRLFRILPFVPRRFRRRCS